MRTEGDKHPTMSPKGEKATIGKMIEAWKSTKSAM